MHKKKLAGVALSIFLILLSLAAWLTLKPPSMPSPQLENLTIGIYAGHLSLPVLVADKYGFFEANGLKVHIKEFESGLAALKALARGETEMATAADIAFVNTLFEKPGLRIISTLATSTFHEAVARKDSGIASPSDLRGRRIGISPGTSGEFFLEIFLIFNRISPEEVTVVELPPSRLVDALAAGEIDAMVAWDIYLYQARQALGENFVSWPAQRGQDFYWLLVSNQGTITAKPRAMENFLKGIVMAKRFIAENEVEARSILSVRWHFHESIVQFFWPQTHFSVSLDQSLIAALEDGFAWKWAKDSRNGIQFPNYLRYIHFDSLDAVSPGAVTIFR